jgi:hypothetical protein
MSAKPCDSCTMIMVNYVDLWLIHSHVASLLDCDKLELRKLKSRSTLLGACTSCPMLRTDLEAAAIEIKDLKHKLDHPSHYTILSPPCEACVSFKGKLFHATKENTELQHEVAYLTTCLDTHIVMSSLIYHLILILMFCLAFTLVLLLALSHVLCLALLLVLCLSSLMDLTIILMVLVHERTALSLDALVTAHVLIVVIISRVGLVFLLDGPSPTLS